MKFLKVLFQIFILSLIVGVGVYIYYTRFSKHVLINPVEYSAFKNVVPESPDLCLSDDNIQYYFYENIPETEQRNNKFGIYIYPDNEKFIKLADELVNSNGGDWGYVLIPFNVQEHDEEKWQRIFFLLHKKHLIPIIQLWNINPDDYKDETEESAEFLNQFPWPIKQRYISVYNEPNDASFWYGEVNPEEYARILDYTIEKFKKESNDFYIMNGALNLTAPNAPNYMDAFEFMWKMNGEVPGIFQRIDAWASHPYPQPAFRGSPEDTGRDSIRGYEDELKFLKDELGVTKDLKVFITETGWPHDVGKTYNPSYLSLSQVSENIKYAYEKVWLPDDRVVAVTPFTIWYDAPHDHFSWVNQDGSPYEHFQTVKAMKKPAGNPAKLATSEIASLRCENAN